MSKPYLPTGRMNNLTYFSNMDVISIYEHALLMRFLYLIIKGLCWQAKTCWRSFKNLNVLLTIYAVCLQILPHPPIVELPTASENWISASNFSTCQNHIKICEVYLELELIRPSDYLLISLWILSCKKSRVICNKKRKLHMCNLI